MTLFREHRGGLAESMATTVTIKNRTELLAYCRTLLNPFDFRFKDEDLTIKPYAFDDRIGWHCHIVHIAGYGVMGFTNGPLEQEIEKG